MNVHRRGLLSREFTLASHRSRCHTGLTGGRKWTWDLLSMDTHYNMPGTVFHIMQCCDTHCFFLVLFCKSSTLNHSPTKTFQCALLGNSFNGGIKVNVLLLSIGKAQMQLWDPTGTLTTPPHTYPILPRVALLWAALGFGGTPCQKKGNTDWWTTDDFFECTQI